MANKSIKTKSNQVLNTESIPIKAYSCASPNKCVYFFILINFYLWPTIVITSVLTLRQPIAFFKARNAFVLRTFRKNFKKSVGKSCDVTLTSLTLTCDEASLFWRGALYCRSAKVCALISNLQLKSYTFTLIQNKERLIESNADLSFLHYRQTA